MPQLMRRRRTGARSIRIDVTKTAIAGNHIRHAGFKGPILAIPIDFARADTDDGAPGRVAEGKARRNFDSHRGCKSAGRERQFDDDLHADILGCRHRESNDAEAG